MKRHRASCVGDVSTGSATRMLGEIAANVDLDWAVYRAMEGSLDARRDGYVISRWTWRTMLRRPDRWLRRIVNGSH